MKKPDKSYHYVEYLRRRAEKAIRRRKKIELKNQRQRKMFQGAKRGSHKEFKEFKYWERVEAPKDFSILDNSENTIDFINKIDFCLKNRRSVFVNIKAVDNIDYGAILMLLSVMALFRFRGVHFNGNYPKNLDIRQKLIDSDFFNQLYNTNTEQSEEYEIKKDNKIFAKANRMVESEQGLRIIEEASTTIWGEKRKCFGVQRILVELMQNTHNHAVSEKEGEEYWWLSVNHDKINKKVSFVFVDHGQGIFESLINKPKGSKWERFASFRALYGNNLEVLRKLLNGDLHLSVTNKPFRGKGLPGIKQSLDRNQISNLYIISNDVFSNVSQDAYIPLNNSLSGSFFYWELCYNNKNSVWNI